MISSVSQNPPTSPPHASMGPFTRAARTLNRWSYGLPADDLYQVPQPTKAPSNLMARSMKTVRTTLLSQDYASFPRIGKVRVPEISIGAMSLVVWSVVGFRYLKGFERAEAKPSAGGHAAVNSNVSASPSSPIAAIRNRFSDMKQALATKDLREEFDITLRDWPLLIFMYAQSPVEKGLTRIAEGVRGIRLRGATGSFIKARSELKDIYTLHNAKVLESLARENPHGFRAALGNLKALCQEFPETLESSYTQFEQKMEAVFSTLEKNGVSSASPHTSSTHVAEEAFDAFKTLIEKRDELIQPALAQLSNKAIEKLPVHIERLQEMEHFLSRYAMLSQLFPRLASFAIVSYAIGYLPTRFLREKSTQNESPLESPVSTQTVSITVQKPFLNSSGLPSLATQALRTESASAPA
jgi:hypothetical protein